VLGPFSSGAPIMPSALPERLNQVSCRRLVPPVREATRPAPDTDTALAEELPRKAIGSALVAQNETQKAHCREGDR
jgi:hypothetical protein